MTHVHEVKMVTNRREAVVESVASIVSLAAVYYMLNPSTLDRHLEIVRSWRDRIYHRISVWQALGAIHSLPETRD